MTSKETKPNLNALNCVSLYKHEVYDTKAVVKRVRCAHAPKPQRRKAHMMVLGQRKKAEQGAGKESAGFPGFWSKLHGRREVSMVDLAVAFGFLFLFSAVATLAMMWAMG